uniref:hypothetical protein n=1 Tax=uncultured Sphingomonas sp. TaxID=158754 RepID=UPI0035CA9AC1
MARAYPNSDLIQPRYAAWLGSIGIPATEAGIAEADQRFGCQTGANVQFMAWVSRCKATAPRAILNSSDRITDHDAFTEHCWKVAFADVLESAA